MHCPFCKKHTEHTVALSKEGGRSKAHPMSYGARGRMRRRGRDRGYGNKGKTSRGAMSSWKRYGAKTSKKVTLKFTCKTCKKSHISVRPRAKRTDFTV